jgi:pimeloyl-[acyl-carrier protein] synthase
MTSEPAGADALPNLFSPAFLRDPYPLYHRLRAADPIHWNGWAWTLTRYADVLAVLRDPRFIAARIQPDDAWLAQTGLEPLFHTHTRMMLFTDPPDHTRLRGLVSQAFTPRVVESLRPRIQALVDELIDAIEAAGETDLIRDLAYPLPVTVIAEMLGVPHDMRDQFRRWSDGVAAFIGGTTAPEMEMLAEAQRCVVEMSAYFREEAGRRRREPRNDLLSALVQAEEAGDRLSSDELIANAILLLVAGHETTTNLIGNGTLALLQHPDQRQRLMDDPALIASAVEELLRYNSPVQGTSRMAAEDVAIDGRQIRRGQHLSLMIGAANRDPAHFADPDALDITRRPNRHLSFAHGPHFCLGAPLARLEGQIAIGTLVRRLPRLALATAEVTWRDNFTLRGLTALPLTTR